jgi:pyruvate dehydrogenase E2 component (dihydrolipoamide acetyltransferase)
MAKDIFIPKLGQTMEEVTFLNWQVKDGDKVEKGQTILEVETDKAVFPVESSASGIVHLGPFQPGQVLPVLAVVAVVGSAEDVFKSGTSSTSSIDESHPVESSPVSVETRSTASNASPVVTEEIFISPRAKKLAVDSHVDWTLIQPTGDEGKRIIERDVVKFLAARPKVSPIAEKIAGEAGVDLMLIQGSGPGGRIMKTDVLRAAESEPALDTSTEVTKVIPLSGIRGVIFSRMAESTHATSRVTLFMEADATRLVELREMLKEKFAKDWGFAAGYNDLLAKICGQALREFPYMNARVNGNQIEWLKSIHMGMAVDTDRGLVVPVIRNVNGKSLHQFGTEFRTLVDKAHAGTLLPDEMNGGTFTITNLGGNDVLAFTPVINLPQAAILGVGKITPALAMKNGQVVEYQKLILSLVFDHRIVDGAPAARFLQWIKDRIEFPELLGFD